MDTSDLIDKVTRSIKYNSSVNIAFVSLRGPNMVSEVVGMERISRSGHKL